ncbi:MULTISPECIES: glutaminase A [unclassified Sedimentibacter]|uniref:glutaminase A n=1 Tax=unclassified Sedimentibacter TaxID=2649220 RepID=UPI0027DF8246|nr:glutaminase A [Sedimentibacter sp. MB35-C1]WMJ78130.1 glutaminase A [Sedimentibacter sp. MB35-C1]
MEDIFRDIIKNNIGYTWRGKVATYIPELAKANPGDLGVCLVTLDGREYSAGDYSKKFTMQSISKVLTFILSLMDNGEKKVFEKVGMEPTGESFNSIVDLELKNIHKPYNPMINAGAIATTSLLAGTSVEEKTERILDLARKLANNPEIQINNSVYLSEKLTGDRNRSIAYFMKSFNIIDGSVEEILDVYFKQCSIEVNCRDIADMGSVLANDGVSPKTGKSIVPKHICRIAKTIMSTCGLYDASGEFAVHIGIPAKSGVGGGIMGAVPKRMGIGVYGPALDEKGNSIAGIQILKELSDKLDLQIY